MLPAFVRLAYYGDNIAIDSIYLVRYTEGMQSESEYAQWLDTHETELADMWSSMGLVERYEEGHDFMQFCRNQFDNADRCSECDGVMVHTCKDCGEECTTPNEIEYHSCSAHIDAEIYSLRN